jgi:two-component system chemotaxis response regulator CheB
MELRYKIKMAAAVDMSKIKALNSKPRKPTTALARTTHKILAIGASTGGTIALEKILCEFPADGPGTVVTQHMPEYFTKAFSKRLNGLSAMNIKEASDGDSIIPGSVLIAPGNQHMLVRRSGARYYVNVKKGPLVNRHRPSVDVMFRSMASHVGNNAIGVILTGMGGDGAKGLLEMRSKGAKTIGQDEASCIVFGMPKVAFEMDAVEQVVALDDIASKVLTLA